MKDGEMPLPKGQVRARVLVSSLRPHPLQAKYFPSRRSQAEIETLGLDMKRNGQREPIEILPDRLIISGHDRREGAIAAEIQKLNVIIRYDLAEAGDAAIELRFHEANTNRKQLTALQKARAAKRMLNLAPKCGDGRGRPERMEAIAAQLGMTARHLRRLLPLLTLPTEFQTAIEEDRLTQEDGAKLAKRGPEAVEEAKRLVADDLEMRAAVKRALKRDPTKLERCRRVRLKVDNFLRDSKLFVNELEAVKEYRLPDWPRRLDLAAAILTKVAEELRTIYAQKEPVTRDLPKPRRIFRRKRLSR